MAPCTKQQHSYDSGLQDAEFLCKMMHVGAIGFLSADIVKAFMKREVKTIIKISNHTDTPFFSLFHYDDLYLIACIPQVSDSK